jgi:hypothetical protein
MKTRKEIIKELYDDRERLFSKLLKNLSNNTDNVKIVKDYLAKTKIIDAQIKVLQMMGDSL